MSGGAYPYRPRTSPPRPVWADLDALLVRPPGIPDHPNGAGVRMTGEAEGVLTHWIPTVDGHWPGRVTYTIAYADGRAPLRMRDQLVPAYALRPRPARQSWSLPSTIRTNSSQRTS